MLHSLRLDIVAPPYAGHLFPLLDLAAFLQEEGMKEIRVLSTRDAGRAIGHMGLRAEPFLVGREDEVHAIANPGHRVGSNPRHLGEQFRKNLSLMSDLQQELRVRWLHRRPDLLIADFTVPLAGFTAQSLGIPWWTTTPSPCAIETKSGTPTYLGGWMPRPDWRGRIRDVLGRALIHGFKRALARLFAKELRSLGINGVYRADGHEVVYSPERIFGLGMREFEFERDWPPAFRFVGPLTGGPIFPHVAPEFDEGKKHVLISMGTHIGWAKHRSTNLLQAVAAAMPDVVFHFTHGVPASTEAFREGNLRHYGYFPYDLYLSKYDAVILHGGTGIVYSSIRAGVPMLVWPQDFDHFDHAARIVFRGLGRKLRERPEHIVADLRFLLQDPTIRARSREFQTLASGYDAKRAIWEEIRVLASEKNLGAGASR